MKKYLTRKNILVFIAIVVLILALVLLISNTQKDKYSKNIDSVYEEATVDGFLFYNGNITHENGLYTYTVDVKNTNDKTKRLWNVNFIFYNSDGSEIATLIGYVNEDIEIDGVRTIYASVDTDIDDYDYVKILIDNN